MHQYEVSEVNCPFRCFPLCVRCINTHAITLYGRILFHSRLSHLHTSPHFINRDQFQQTWQQNKDWKSERMHTNTKFVTTCVQLHQTVPSYAVEVQLKLNCGLRGEGGNRLRKCLWIHYAVHANYSRSTWRSHKPSVRGIQKDRHLPSQLQSLLIYSTELSWLRKHQSVETFQCDVANYCLILGHRLQKVTNCVLWGTLAGGTSQFHTDGACWTSSKKKKRKKEHAPAWNALD